MTHHQFRQSLNFKIHIGLLLCLILLASCSEKTDDLKVVTYSAFELFVSESGYVTDAEKYGWSIVQTDVLNFKKVGHATWRTPDGTNEVASGNLPVTQVSYTDAIAYCKWADKRLPSYDEYWKLVVKDDRVIVSDNKLPISDVNKVNIVGNVWDITQDEKNDLVRLAGGSLFCSESTCHGTVKERELFVDKATGNIHIGFSVIDL